MVTWPKTGASETFSTLHSEPCSTAPRTGNERKLLATGRIFCRRSGSGSLVPVFKGGGQQLLRPPAPPGLYTLLCDEKRVKLSPAQRAGPAAMAASPIMSLNHSFPELPQRPAHLWIASVCGARRPIT